MQQTSVSGAGSQRPASAFAEITAPKPGFLFHAFGIRSRRFMHALREAIKEDAFRRLGVTDPREVKEVVRQVLQRMGMSSLSQVEAGSQQETQKNLARFGRTLNLEKAKIEQELALKRAGEAFDRHLGTRPDDGFDMGLFDLLPWASHEKVVTAIGKGLDAAFPDAGPAFRQERVVKISTAALQRDPRTDAAARFDSLPSGADKRPITQKIQEARSKLLEVVRISADGIGHRQDDLPTIGFQKGSDTKALKDRLRETIIGGIVGLKQVLAPLVAAGGSDLKVEIAEGKIANAGELTVLIEGSEKPNDQRFRCLFAMNENSGEVNLDILQVPENQMGGDHAKRVLKALVELIALSRKGCLNALQLQANINIGTYAWAKAFHPRDQDQLEKVIKASIGRFEHYSDQLQPAMSQDDFTSLKDQIKEFKKSLERGQIDNHHFDALRDVKLPVNMAKATLHNDLTLKNVKEAVQGEEMAAGKLLMILSSYHDGAWYGEARVGKKSWEDLLCYLYPGAPGPRDL